MLQAHIWLAKYLIAMLLGLAYTLLFCRGCVVIQSPGKRFKMAQFGTQHQ